MLPKSIPPVIVSVVPVAPLIREKKFLLYTSPSNPHRLRRVRGVQTMQVLDLVMRHTEDVWLFPFHAQKCTSVDQHRTSGPCSVHAQRCKISCRPASDFRRCKISCRQEHRTSGVRDHRDSVTTRNQTPSEHVVAPDGLKTSTKNSTHKGT